MKPIKLTLAILIASIGLSTSALAQNADTGAAQKRAQTTTSTQTGVQMSNGTNARATDDQSDAMYDAAKKNCDALGTATTAKMNCIGIARAERNYREAQAEAQREPSAENKRDVMMAKAHLDYANAKAKCEASTSGQGPSTGVPASLCMAKANEAKNKALAAAKVGTSKGWTRSKRGDIGQEK